MPGLLHIAARGELGGSTVAGAGVEIGVSFEDGVSPGASLEDRGARGVSFQYPAPIGIEVPLECNGAHGIGALVDIDSVLVSCEPFSSLSPSVIGESP